MSQKGEESVSQFTCRLKQQASNCGFHSVDEAVRDQLIEKCKDTALRRKFLEKEGTVTLTDLEKIANAFEAVVLQIKTMNSAQNVTVN